MNQFSMNIVSAGAATNVGLSLSTTTAAIRAGLDRFQETTFYDEFKEPIIGAPIAPESIAYKKQHRTGGKTHLSNLLTLVIEECLVNAGITMPLPTSVPLLFLGDDTRSHPLADAIQLCLSQMQDFIQPDGNTPRIIQGFTQGEASCAFAISAAEKYLQQGAPFVLIAAADSWLNVSDIESSLNQQRLLTSENSAGFIPGEGAAAILLAHPTKEHAARSLHVCGLGIGQEQATLSSDQPCYGQGMASAIKNALAQANMPIHTIGLRVSDISGEEYFFEEAAYAWARLLRESQPLGHQHLMPATSVGQIGCVFGPLSIAYLWQLLKNQRLFFENILLHLSSAQAERSAIVLKVINQ